MPLIAPPPAEEPGNTPEPGRGVRALVVDDEPNIRWTLGLCLRQMGCEVEEAGSGQAAAAAIRERLHDVAFLDLRLGSESGIDVLPTLLSLRHDLDVVIITAFSSFESAVEAMRRGARDYLPKPFTPAQIRDVVERIRERRRLESRVSSLEELEREHVMRVIARTPTLAEASRILGIDVATLWRKRKKWGR